jgi:hypothetical protein
MFDNACRLQKSDAIEHTLRDLIPRENYLPKSFR